VIFAERFCQSIMKKYIPLIVFVTIISLASCIPFEKLPPEPKIEFRAFTLYDTVDILGNAAKAGKLTFYFEDGDGDLGWPEADTGTYTTNTNLFFQLYRRKNGVFELAPPTDPLYPSEYRIPYMEVQGQNKILRGTIDVSMIYFFYDPTDTLYYNFWVRDRAGNDSNTDSTCIFIMGVNSTCKKN
jgi:hypothetical protein